MYIGKGEEATGGRSRPALLADVFEAFIGALYLDQNFDATLNFLKSNVFPRIEVGAFSHAMDYKVLYKNLFRNKANKSVTKSSMKLDLIMIGNSLPLVL